MTDSCVSRSTFRSSKTLELLREVTKAKLLHFLKVLFDSLLPGEFIERDSRGFLGIVVVALRVSRHGCVYQISLPLSPLALIYAQRSSFST